MSNVPSELKYTSTHEWVRQDDDGIVTVGITDHAQELLGDLVYVELPELGAEAHSGNEIGVVESVKAASDIYSPISGEVIAINEKLNDTPELVNHDSYGEGWLFKLKPADDDELNELLDAEDYEDQLESEAH